MADSYFTTSPRSVFVTDAPVVSLDVAADENGNFVVVWETEENIRFQVFDSDGDAITNSQELDTFEESFPSNPSVSMLPDGTFAIAYDVLDIFDGDREIEVQSFDVSGEQIGDTLNVTSNIDEDRNPDIALAENGELLVTWENYVNEDDSDIVVSYFDSEDNFVDSYTIASTSNPEYEPAIAIRKGDIFSDETSAIVTFTQDDEFSGQDVLFQRLEGTDFELNGDPINIIPDQDESGQRHSSVAMDENGNSIVTFTDTLFGDDDVVLTSVAENGEFFTKDVATTENGEDNSTVAMTRDGSFVIAYSDETNDTTLLEQFDRNTDSIDRTEQEDIVRQPIVTVSPNGDYLVLAGRTSDDNLEAFIYTQSSNGGGNGDNNNIVDFNRDGKSDVLWRNDFSGDNRVWLMDDRDILDSDPIDSRDNLDWYVGGAGDFDGNGNTDVVWRNSSTGQNEIWFMDETEVIDIQEVERERDQDWQIKGVGDFNDDGNADLVWRNESNGKNGVWYMDGAEVIGTDNLPRRRKTEWDIYGVNDFNNDGRVDLLWHNQLKGGNQVWFMDGTTQDDVAGISPERNDEWYIGTTGDFNSDDNIDIVWRNSSSGNNRVWFMNGADNGTLERLERTSFPSEFNTDWQIV